MTRRVPLIPTILVAAAVATMIALGLWQLRQMDRKEQLLTRLAANRTAPPIAFPKLAPVLDDALFRRSGAMCLKVVGWQVEAGRSAAGASGYRNIAQCQTGAEGPGLLVDMGVTADAKFRSPWTGGQVTGVITEEPNHTSVIARLFGKAPPLRPMLVSDRAAPGLAVSAPPSTESIPNNHFSYAIQWFLFAGIALVIYVLALRKRSAVTS